MIFYFDSSIIDKSNARIIASYLKLIHEQKHKIDYADPSVWTFMENEVLTTNYLGRLDIEAIKENQELRDVRRTDRGYLCIVEVGKNYNQIDLKTLGIILTNKSYIVLENSHYDWCPIKVWIDMLKNDRDYKDINRKVAYAVEQKWICPEHAGGGNGTIVNKIKDLEASIFLSATRIKVTTIFDSDKKSAPIPSEKNEALKTYLNDNSFNYHEWDRREIENYIPLRIYKAAGLVNQNIKEPDTQPENWNYEDLPKHPYFIGKYKKDKLQHLARYIDDQSVRETFVDKSYENPYDKHMVTEIQHVIFMLAKYI